MAALGPLLILGSTIGNAVGMAQQGAVDEMTSKATADQLDRKAMGERAVASVQAERTQKEADNLISKQRAIAAASGGGTGGSAATIMAETAGRGSYNSELDLWMGEEKAAGHEYAADVERAEAKAKKRALPLQIGTAILSGVSSAYRNSPLYEPQAPSSYRYG